MTDDLFKDIEQYLKTRGTEDEDGFEGKALTKNELEFIIMKFAESRGKKGFTEDEVVNFVRFIESTKVNMSLVNLFFKELIYLDDPSGEFKDEIIVTLTPFGLEERKKLN